MYEKEFQKCDAICSWTASYVTNCHTFSDPLPYSWALRTSLLPWLQRRAMPFTNFFPREKAFSTILNALVLIPTMMVYQF